MARIDLAAFVGTWPFHYVENRTFEDLKKLHKANNIDYGYVSSTEAIFYQDPYEADFRLARELKGSDYKHVVTLNPANPGSGDSLRRMVREFPVAGVRLYPGFHGYRLHDECVEGLYKVIAEFKLPIFLTLRMEDERSEYMIQVKNIPGWDIDAFVAKHTDVPIVISNARNSELRGLAHVIKECPHVSFDCTGFKNELFAIDDFHNNDLLKYVSYGSLAPVFCMRSTVLLIETADIPQVAKDDVFAAKAFFKTIDYVNGK